ncbi:hypothetical protein FOZ62_011408, partial [Perkinsus olseni]
SVSQCTTAELSVDIATAVVGCWLVFDTVDGILLAGVWGGGQLRPQRWNGVHIRIRCSAKDQADTGEGPSSPGAEGKRGRRDTLLSVKLNDRIMQLIGPLSTTVVSMQAAMALPATAPVPLAVACIPIVIPLTIEVDRMGFPLTDAGKSAMKGLLISSVLQGSLGGYFTEMCYTVVTMPL